DGRYAGLGEQRAQDLHSALHGVGSEQHLGHEQNAVAKIDADDAHSLDEGVVQRLLGVPAALEKEPRGFLDLSPQAVLEVIVHVLYALLVDQIAEIELAFGCLGHGGNLHARPKLRRAGCSGDGKGGEWVAGAGTRPRHARMRQPGALRQKPRKASQRRALSARASATNFPWWLVRSALGGQPNCAR